MAANNVEELLDLLYSEIEDAKNMPLSSDKCVVERDKILDMIDDVKAEFPSELARARELVENKNDYIAAAQEEVEEMRQRAEAYVRDMVDEDAITADARKEADEIIEEAEEQAAMLKESAIRFCEDALRNLEEAMADAFDEVRRARSGFMAAMGIEEDEPKEAPRRSSGRVVYDVEDDLDD